MSLKKSMHESLRFGIIDDSFIQEINESQNTDLEVYIEAIDKIAGGTPINECIGYLDSNELVRIAGKMEAMARHNLGDGAKTTNKLILVNQSLTSLTK